MPDQTPQQPDETPHQPEWEEREDGSRVRIVNGIRIVDHTARAEPPRGPIEHLVAREEEDGRVVILGLNAERVPVYTTTLRRKP
jgi:hypothetical protein